ncbi:MAG TPA: hypothetical protein VKY85_08070 [Candidatus Angelobacter sp.]|nr:hypothetical protein [Candidatus Angelobacter sp.]
MKLISAVVLSVLLAVAPAYPETFPSQSKNETTSSLGIVRIQVVRKFAKLFEGCQGYDAGTRKFTSPVALYDPATEISLSAALVEKDLPGRPDPTTMSDQLTLPFGFADPPDNNREVHTEITSLKMVGGGLTIRAGRWYDGAGISLPAEHWRSRGEIFSDAKAGQIGKPEYDFPARSFFNVFVNIDIARCGHLPAATTTLYNKLPLIVSADKLLGLPPNVIYEHDTSSAVAIYLKEQRPVVELPGRRWKHQDELVGYLLLAGHGVGQDGVNSAQNQQKLKDQVLGRPEAQPPCDQ